MFLWPSQADLQATNFHPATLSAPHWTAAGSFSPTSCTQESGHIPIVLICVDITFDWTLYHYIRQMKYVHQRYTVCNTHFVVCSTPQQVQRAPRMMTLKSRFVTNQGCIRQKCHRRGIRSCTHLCEAPRRVCERPAIHFPEWWSPTC